MADLRTVEETQRRLRVGRPKLYELIMSGELESVKIGARRLIPDDAIDAYIAKIRAEQADDPAPAA